ncbi:MAG: hypothetical protein M3O31_15660 [Acidobacteriota bacterium]|nr:hypothetical protein [Acidobacteriota bacterium]
MALSHQFAFLLMLALPIACVSWTVTHEEVFREPRDFCKERSEQCRPVVLRKFFYLFTCEYCFSHYVTAFFLVITRFTLLYDGWRGYMIAWFALVWVANVYMSAFNRLRLEIKHENVKIATEEVVKEKVEEQAESKDPRHSIVRA